MKDYISKYSNRKDDAFYNQIKDYIEFLERYFILYIDLFQKMMYVMIEK